MKVKAKYLLPTALLLSAGTTQANENTTPPPKTNKITEIIKGSSEEIADVYHISEKDFVSPETPDTIINQDQNLEKGGFYPEKFVVTIKNIINTGTTIELENYMNKLTKNDIKALQLYLTTYKDEVNTGEYPIGSTVKLSDKKRVLGGGALSIPIQRILDTENGRVQSGVDRESGQPFFFLKSIQNGIEIIMRSHRITYYPKMENGEYFYEKEEIIVNNPIIIATYEGYEAYIQNANDFADATYTEKKETNASKAEREKKDSKNQTQKDDHQKIYHTYEKQIKEYKLSAKNEKKLINTLKDLSKKNPKNNEAFTTDAQELMKTAQEYKNIEKGEKDYKKYRSISFSEEEQQIINKIIKQGLKTYLKENDLNENDQKKQTEEKELIKIYTKVFKYLDIKNTNNNSGFTPLDMSINTKRSKLIEELRESIENIRLAINKEEIKRSKNIEQCILSVEKLIQLIYNIGDYRDSNNARTKRFLEENFKKNS